MLLCSMLVAALICFGVPIGGMIFIGKKYDGKWRWFFLGALVFFVSQICIRLPILQLVLPQFAWFHLMQASPVVYGLFMGGTAALVEEGGRLLVKVILQKKGRLSAGIGQGLALGLGHGGIEAILLVGLNTLIWSILISMGMQSTIPGLDIVAPSDFMVSALERFFTMGFHVGATLLVMRGRFWLAFLLHTITDAAIVILPAMLGIGILGLEIWIGVISIVTLVLGIASYLKKGRVLP